MTVKIKRRIKLYLFILIVLVGIVIIVFNEKGILKYWKLKSEVNSVNEGIEKIDKENKQLEAEVDSLEKKIPAKIEKTAREKYNMIRKGEKVIEVK